jgi:hypothetical protein
MFNENWVNLAYYERSAQSIKLLIRIQEYYFAFIFTLSFHQLIHTNRQIMIISGSYSSDYITITLVQIPSESIVLDNL